MQESLCDRVFVRAVNPERVPDIARAEVVADSFDARHMRVEKRENARLVRFGDFESLRLMLDIRAFLTPLVPVDGTPRGTERPRHHVAVGVALFVLRARHIGEIAVARCVDIDLRLYRKKPAYPRANDVVDFPVVRIDRRQLCAEREFRPRLFDEGIVDALECLDVVRESEKRPLLFQIFNHARAESRREKVDSVGSLHKYGHESRSSHSAETRKAFRQKYTRPVFGGGDGSGSPRRAAARDEYVDIVLDGNLRRKVYRTAF